MGQVLCWECVGDIVGSPSGETCQTCGRIGLINLEKTPKSLSSKDGKTYFEQYIYLKNYKLWPNEGGLARQNSKFLKVVDYCDRIKYKLEEMRQHEEDVNRKLASKQHG